MRKKHHAEHPAATTLESVPDGGAVEATLPAAEASQAAAEGLPQDAEGGSAVPAPGPAGAAPAGAFPAAPSAAPGGERAGLEAEVAELKDRLLRTAADFDNFRKRAAREKAETWGRAQADAIQRVLDVIDDLARVAHLDPAQTSAESLHEGVGLVERKLLKVLDGVGLERVDPSGQLFDPNAHEAVMTTPAPSEAQDGMVATVLQAGYRMNGALLRPARVAVFAYVEPAPGETVH